MGKTVAEPKVEDGAILFSIAMENNERECVLSRNAVVYLNQLTGLTEKQLEVYRIYENQIHKVAKRLILAGESASPLILGAGYFIDLSVSVRP